MNEYRQVCADFCYEDENCSYAKIVEETGEYPVIIFQAKEKGGIPDLSTMHNVRTRVDTTCSCVYCTHPSYSKEKFIGSVEPYFPCRVPSDCPKLHSECKTVADKKPTILKIIMRFLKRQ